MAKTERRAPVKTGLHVVAVFEAAKGMLVLLAGFGILTFIHKDVHRVAEELVRHLHLNPASHYPSIFLDAADRVTDLQLWALALSALIYAVVRLAEAYGLWKQLQWAEWFGLLTGGMYIPMEIFEVLRRASWPRITVLIVNLAIVGYLSYVLFRTRAHRQRGRNG
jgi:uncharacterized membrane protein (DUF2068 family)